MIVVNRKIRSGIPTIKGTRLTVLSVISAFNQGFSVKEIVSLCRRSGSKVKGLDIREAIKYGSQNV